MLDLEMRQLEYFITAASAGSYSQAAKHLFVSPQAVSKGVQVLESRIGVALFERGPNGIALTSFGETFYQEAETVLQAMERLQRMAEEHRCERGTSLSVGIHSLCFKEHGGSIDWNDLLHFQEIQPSISPSFLEMLGDAVISSVLEGSIDFGISVLPITGLELLESTLLKTFPLAAIVSRDSDHFGARTTTTIEDLSGGHLVLLPGESEFNNFFLGKAHDENLSIEVSSLQIRTDSDIDFVINKNLYAVRPLQHATRTTKGENIRILPILNAAGEQINMPLFLFWMKGRVLSNVEQSFVEMIANLYHPELSTGTSNSPPWPQSRCDAPPKADLRYYKPNSL